MINNYNLIDKMSKWIEDEGVTGHTFLFSAATLSNYLIYHLYKNFDTNQYIDIGSSFGFHLGLKGSFLRGYLNHYWNYGVLSNEVDIWN